MHLSIIQRIIIGFGIVITFVVAISVFAYFNQSKMAQQLELASVKMTNLLAQSNLLGQNLQNVNRAVLVHANTDSVSNRNKLEQAFYEEKQRYLSNYQEFYNQISSFPALQAHLSELDTIAQRIFIGAEQQIDVKNGRMNARLKTSQELNQFDEKWKFFEQDISDLAATAKSNNQRTNNRNLNYIVAQGTGADRYLQKIYAMEDVKDAEVVRQELVTHIERFKDKAKRVPQSMPESKDSITFYLDQLKRAIEQPEGVLQQHLTYMQLTATSDQLLGQLAVDMDEAINSFEMMGNDIGILVSQTADEAQTDSDKALLLNASLAAISTVIALALSSTIVLSIKRPLRKIVEALDKITSGDLTHRIETGFQSELGAIAMNINALGTQLSDVITQVQQSADTLSDVANESHILSNKTNIDVAKQQKQTDSIRQSVTEMKLAIDTVAGSAKETSDEVDKITVLAHNNMDSMQQNLVFVNQLQGSLVEATDVIHQLSNESRQIGDILTVIQSISEQTNLLALNAAIEAARAGEQGRGFAVVADEVRSLATRTQRSANDIDGMISNLQSQAERAVTLVENNLEKAAASVNQTNVSNQSLDSMVKRLSSINDMSRHIAEDSIKQSAVAQEVMNNIAYISKKAVSIAEEVNESARNSESLNALSSRQSELISHFVIR
ncbi:Methyl-accepting chemotaxis protein [Vibrio coralliirubri]|nr:Methyl-accepting chemotaxis protein [Vibrio coralliirubri]